jgi:hypothetical protein
MKEMSDLQIEKQFKGENRFGGVYNKDDLNVLDNNKCYIFNMDKKSGSGTHWICISNISPNYVYYFDSYGEPSPDHLVELMHHTHKNIIYNTKQLQNLQSSSCGEWCVFFLKQILKGKKPQEILNYFSSNPTDSEHKLNDYF